MTLLELLWLLAFCAAKCLASTSNYQDFSDPDRFLYSTSPASIDPETSTSGIEFSERIIENRPVTMRKEFSPYIVRNDIVVEPSGELVIEPGVVVKFAPMVGITVRGALIAKGQPEDRITLTSLDEPSWAENLPEVRLVDGDNVRQGRLQIRHRDKWRSVCSNSRNWTRSDLETACRHLGFGGGRWWRWVDREAGITEPRLLYEAPNCKGNEQSLFHCEWNTRQLGSGVCDYHPDIGIECSPRHENRGSIGQHWRGIFFQNARSQRVLSQHNTLYVDVSYSYLTYTQIRYAGVGKDYSVSSAVSVQGVAPTMDTSTVEFSAYNAFNFTNPLGTAALTRVTIARNRGYGVYVNSTEGRMLIEQCTITDNGADGIRYVKHDSEVIDRSALYDFCTVPTTAGQTFPINIAFEQNYFSQQKDCVKHFYTRHGQVLTLQFQQMFTSENDSSVIDIFDGSGESDRLLMTVNVRNGTKPQSLVTTRNNVFFKFSAKTKTNSVAVVKIISSYQSWYDLNVTSSSIAENSGRGIAVENIRNQLFIRGSSVSGSNHVAGVHVLSGAANVNITVTRIAFNQGDGVNISYAGGTRNISHSFVSSNKRYGIAVWLHEKSESEYVAANQETIVAYNEIFNNIQAGVRVGNFCENSLVNISSNSFNNSFDSCVEVGSCWRKTPNLMRLLIAHNEFIGNRKLSIKLTPLLNTEALIEHNKFIKNTYGCVLIRNGLYPEFRLLPSKVVIRNNELSDNTGVYVANLGLSPYSEVQTLLFTLNFVRHNKVSEPFPSKGLNPRSRVAAVIAVSSENTHIYRNIIQNEFSAYEIGSHLVDQSRVINCTYNWLGSPSEEKIFERLFHRNDRYNLAKIEFLPYLLHASNPVTTKVMANPTFVPQFYDVVAKIVGGEVDGQETLRAGEYTVMRDINIRPGGRLSLEPEVTLRFPPGIGIMVGGKLEARGKRPHDIRLTIKELESRTEVESVVGIVAEDNIENETAVPEVEGPSASVRLFGGRSPYEGRLQVRIENRWGTVCNYGWTMLDASLVCHQLGFILNPDDWNLKRSEMPEGGTAEPVFLSNVRCSEQDLDLVLCKSENVSEMENTCTHEEDVGVRCYEPKWAGIRFGVLAERSNLQYITVEHAGLLDYSINQLSPAVQIDFNRHVLDNVRINHNIGDGLGILYSDLYSNADNIIKYCEFADNYGAGISIKQFGLKISGSNIADNKVAGIRHNPAISVKQQQEIAGWFRPMSEGSETELLTSYQPVYIPEYSAVHIDINDGETKYLVTQRLINAFANKSYIIRTKSRYMLGIQLLNPIYNGSTESITIYDTTDASGMQAAAVWQVGRDLTTFPTTSRSTGIILEYKSGADALGNVVLLVTAVPPHFEERTPSGVFISKLFPTLSIVNTRITNNKRGIWSSYYNRYLSTMVATGGAGGNTVDETGGGEHYLRVANETLTVIACDISRNEQEAILVQSPTWDIPDYANMSEITITVNASKIVSNGRGIYQFSRDIRNSNNLFHWFMHENTVESNSGGAFEVSLPYVWQYNENFTHSVRLHNNTWRDNRDFAVIVDGHYAQLNITKNEFDNNLCREGLISVRGMEKAMYIRLNTITRNAGTHMIEFRADSQSEIRGELRAIFYENIIKRNLAPITDSPCSLIVFDGLQRVRISRNLMSDNTLPYSLVAGLRTAHVDSEIDVTDNWWGTTDPAEITRRIFDFDDWNNHAVAKFKPYLFEDSFDASVSASSDYLIPQNVNYLAGRLSKSLTLRKRPEPYEIHSDLTVMSDATLTILPGVVMEFAPRVGLLVLGSLNATGYKTDPIILRPIKKHLHRSKRSAVSKTLRLCTTLNCTVSHPHEGFLEYWNATTMQWVPICDKRFTEPNARVVCRELGLPTMNAWVTTGRRHELLPNTLARIWSWPEPIQCAGHESRWDECPIRLNGQVYGQKYNCDWDSSFVFVHCSNGYLDADMDYWGGIRFANKEFESNDFEARIHNPVTHATSLRSESILQHVNIVGAGMLHHHKSPAVLSVAKSPEIRYVNISKCASHGISLISPEHNVKLLNNRVERCLGIGVTVTSLTGERGESKENSFTPLKTVHIPYNAFSLLDICDPVKEITVEERIVLYYKYTNNPVTCIKIFHSAHYIKPFGFRFLQFNMFGSRDTISLYDGSIYNVSSKILATVNSDSHVNQFIRTEGPTLSIKMIASGMSEYRGFIAEIVTMPISAIGFNREVQHNISYSVLNENWGGAAYYTSAGEVNPSLTLEWNQISNNCAKLYGNFTSCDSAVTLDFQNIQNLYFRNNLVRNNVGGLKIRADSSGSATALKGYIHNNLFCENKYLPTLSIEGRKSSPYQEVEIYRNFWTENNSPYNANIKLSQVVSNFTYNYVYNNVGSHILEFLGFERVRLAIYQTTSHNGFYWNQARERDWKGTILAGTPGQHYVDNVFFNPNNDYELITTNRSLNDPWKIPIDARLNFWGYNESLAVDGRIWDYADDYHYLEVNYQPYHRTNASILDGKCPPGWSLVGDTCYIYVAAPMTFREAREFCKSANTSMPYIMGNYAVLYQFLRSQQKTYTFYERVWIQNIDLIDRCTVYTFQTIREDNCLHLNPFICEMDPKVIINPLSWTGDLMILGFLSFAALAAILVALVIVMWFAKSRHRRVERLKRRSSIRQSLNSLRSISSSQGAFSELGFKRRTLSSQMVNPSLAASNDYKKMNGSVDSIEKSQFTMSLDDETRSYDIYETNVPNRSPDESEKYDLVYRNQGYRDNSTFASRDTSAWQSSDYVNESSTLPMGTSVVGIASVGSKADYERDVEYQVYYERPKSSGALLETNLDEPGLPALPPRSKSEELLETNFDHSTPERYSANASLRFQSSAARSKSQPLETAM